MKVFDMKDKRFWNLMINLGLPIVIQNLVLNSLTLVDNVLIGGLGDVSIAGVGIANKLTFIFQILLFGVNSGANILSAQFWGKKDLSGVRKVLGLSLMLSMTVAVPLALVGIFIPDFIIDIFSNDPEVIRQGAGFLAIIALSYPITAITTSYSMLSRGVGRTRVPLISSVIALTLNTVLAYILIYGKFGMPKLGVNGAAVATLISRIVECGILLGIIYWNKLELAAKLSEFRGYTKDFMTRFSKPVAPVILNEILWSIGVTGYTYFYGVMGTEAVATVQILDVINGIFYALFQGMGNACGSITGNLIGSNEEDTAKVYAKRTVVVGAFSGIIISGLLLLTTPFFLTLFNISEATVEACKRTVIVYAAFMIPRVTGMIMNIGACRGGGDTTFGAMVDAGAPWVIGLPMAYLGVQIFRLPIYWVMAMINMADVVRCIILLIRLLSDKWVHNLVKDFETV